MYGPAGSGAWHQLAGVHGQPVHVGCPAVRPPCALHPGMWHSAGKSERTAYNTPTEKRETATWRVQTSAEGRPDIFHLDGHEAGGYVVELPRPVLTRHSAATHGAGSNTDASAQYVRGLPTTHAGSGLVGPGHQLLCAEPQVEEVVAPSLLLRDDALGVQPVC